MVRARVAFGPRALDYRRVARVLYKRPGLSGSQSDRSNSVADCLLGISGAVSRDQDWIAYSLIQRRCDWSHDRKRARGFHEHGRSRNRSDGFIRVDADADDGDLARSRGRVDKASERSAG